MSLIKWEKIARDCADAYREVKDESELIPAEELSERIKTLSFGNNYENEDGLIQRTLDTYENDRVTNIGSNAFYNCSGLRSITIPGSVTKISGGAFSGCTSLASIVIPDSVTQIQAYCDDYSYSSSNATFYGCKSLKNIILKGSNKEKLLALRKRLLDINSDFEISFEI
jgi:hypothetical protein